MRPRWRGMALTVLQLEVIEFRQLQFLQYCAGVAQWSDRRLGTPAAVRVGLRPFSKTHEWPGAALVAAQSLFDRNLKMPAPAGQWISLSLVPTSRDNAASYVINTARERIRT